MWETCKPHGHKNCRDKRCARKLNSTKKRANALILGRLKLMRKNTQRIFPPGSCGIHRGKLFTVIGWGQTKLGVWCVLVSIDGAIISWNCTELERACVIEDDTLRS